jgi:hypothetical protein
MSGWRAASPKYGARHLSSVSPRRRPDARASRARAGAEGAGRGNGGAKPKKGAWHRISVTQTLQWR